MIKEKEKEKESARETTIPINTVTKSSFFVVYKGRRSSRGLFRPRISLKINSFSSIQQEKRRIHSPQNKKE